MMRQSKIQGIGVGNLDQTERDITQSETRREDTIVIHTRKTLLPYCVSAERSQKGRLKKENKRRKEKFRPRLRNVREERIQNRAERETRERGGGS